MSITSSAADTPTGLANAIEAAAGKGQTSQGISLNTFFASLAGATGAFAVQILLFIVIKDRLARI